MTTDELIAGIAANLPFAPTKQQAQMAAALARYLAADSQESAFILNGYAGTGKTSLVGALVKALNAGGVPTQLMAPTGRAAKVFSSMASQRASTIHRRIYRLDGPPGIGSRVTVGANPVENAVFIVDEASMIGDEPGEGFGSGGSLLLDLIEYVYGGADGAKLIFVGDTAQLPPVGSDRSPAMDADHLRSLGLKVVSARMTSTVRQRRGSEILANATRLRKQMLMEPIPRPEFSWGDDVDDVAGYDLLDSLSTAYAYEGGIDDTIVITRSNRAATAANGAIRNEVLGRCEELVVDDRLMVVKNNYIWAKGVKGLDFIANGDMVEVVDVKAKEEVLGLRFADVTLKMAGDDEFPPFDAKIALNTLTSNSPAFEPGVWQQFHADRIAAMPPGMSPADIRRMLRTDPYINALQVKYGYAVTCHKAQGGQWSDVFVDIGGLGMMPGGDLELHRWLYTALTRARKRLHLVNVPDA